ncbi:MAG: AbrB/MazE/SpoVT family DNA-binding domain-containing protein [Bacillota bacterium]|nr:AbrB/MazE/SpoVT family DNA-binding domain-containing protein [Bacillota bacterium]
MKTVKLRKIGNSFGFTIPKELMEKYNLAEGNELHVVETKDGFTLTPYDPEFDLWAASFENTNNKFKNTLKNLAK